MSGATTVRELVTKLLEYDLDQPVYIGLGSSSLPDWAAEIMLISKYSTGVVTLGGVYLIPSRHLSDA